MIDDPAARSVRVAVALCDRFAELLKGPSQVTARKQEGALLGFSGNQDELSLRIGEAQQIYPEIWRHLDDARTGFAGRGIEVAGYDALRAQEGQGLGAAVDVDHKKHGVGQHAIHVHVKAANFNHVGLQRARKACNALMQATPQIDWAGIAKAEANDPAAAAFARATRTKRMIQFGILGLMIAAPFLIIMYMQREERVKADERRRDYNDPVARQAKPLSDAERSELTVTVSQLRASLATARKNWAAAAGPDALKALVPGTRPCALAVHEPGDAAADKYIRTGDVDRAAFESSAFRGYIAAVKDLPDGDLRYAENLVTQIDKRLTTATADATDRERLADLELYSTSVLIDNDINPEVTQTAPKITYKAGEVTGRAYVFSLKEGKFVCTANITARNTPSEESPKFLDGVRRAPEAVERLHRELEVRIRQALATNLKSTEP
jgi:hypothetical protein